MKRLPEGVRRICIVLGLLLAAGWFVYVAITSGGFSHMGGLFDWFLFAVGLLILFFVPSVIYRTVRWIREGFAFDSHQ